MLPPEPNLEVRSRRPTRPSGGPPLLFVHGGYCDARCWDRHIRPWFAARGYAAHALSWMRHVARQIHDTLVSRSAGTAGRSGRPLEGRLPDGRKSILDTIVQ